MISISLDAPVVEIIAWPQVRQEMQRTFIPAPALPLVRPTLSFLECVSWEVFPRGKDLQVEENGVLAGGGEVVGA